MNTSQSSVLMPWDSFGDYHIGRFVDASLVVGLRKSYQAGSLIADDFAGDDGLLDLVQTEANSVSEHTALFVEHKVQP